MHGSYNTDWGGWSVASQEGSQKGCRDMAEEWHRGTGVLLQAAHLASGHVLPQSFAVLGARGSTCSAPRQSIVDLSHTGDKSRLRTMK